MLLVGLGAVSTTFIAGVIAIRKGLAKPIGSLTQMGHIRLGKRTEGRSPMINEVVPLAGLDDLVFGGWDIFAEDCYSAAKTAGVLEPALLEQVRPELEKIRPWPAVFDQHYVKRLDGPNVKKGKTKRDLAEQVMADIQKFKKDNDLDRLVMIWAGSTEIYMTESDGAPVDGELRARARGERPGDSAEHGVRLRRDPGRHSVRERGAEPVRRHSCAGRAGVAHEVADCRQGHEDRARR